MELMPSIPGQRINLVMADLPYNTTKCEWDCEIDLAATWREWERMLAPGGCVILFGAMPFTAALYNSNPKWFRDHLVWNKNKCGSPALAKIRPMRVHEDILIFAPKAWPVPYVPKMEVGEPYSRKSKNPEGYVGKKNSHGYGMKPRTEFVNTGTRYPKSIRNVSRDFSAQQQLNAAQKPVPLIKWLIESYSKPGATVLDNTMGSGSTGIACLELGDREFIGMEKCPKEFAKAQARINAAVAANDNRRADIFLPNDAGTSIANPSDDSDNGARCL